MSNRCHPGWLAACSARRLPDRTWAAYFRFQGITLISEVFFPYQDSSDVADKDLAAEFDRQSFVIVTEPHGGGFHLVIPKEVSSGANLLQFQIHPEAL